MKNYTNQQGEIYAYESDGTQDHLISEDLVRLNSERPSEFHKPIINNGIHKGWSFDEIEKRKSTIPEKISSRQGKIALLNVDLLDTVENILDAMTDSKQKRIAQIEFNHSIWEINSPFLQKFWKAMGGTQEELEDLFIEAQNF